MATKQWYNLLTKARKPCVHPNRYEHEIFARQFFVCSSHQGASNDERIRRPITQDHSPEGTERRRRISDIIFETFHDGGNLMALTALRNAVLRTGVLWKTDPRLENFRTRLTNWREQKEGANAEPTHVTSDELFSLIRDFECLDVLARGLSHQFVIPDFLKFAERIQGIYDRVKLDNSGSLATYIPQLAKEDPSRFGIALCTVDGQRFSIGDAEMPFCLQSCVKPIQYAVAVSDHTSQFVHERIGKEPSGSNFNAITLNFEEKPHNPMINPGALVVCSLLKPDHPLAERFEHVQHVIKTMAGGEYTSFHNAVFQSEKKTSYRNYALAYLLKEKNCFPQDAEVEETVDLYLQLCAVKMTCSSASVAAATLANGGVCPLEPEKRVLDGVSVRNTLALMHSCGMYDYSGVFAFHVGLPAKSGVAGGLMVVVPNVMGMMIWSPLLDERGNSVRGLRFCKEFVRQFNFHVYDNLRHSERKSDPRTYKQPLTELEGRLQRASSEMLYEES